MKGADYLERIAKHGDRLALADAEGEHTYADLIAACERSRAWIAAEGVQPGDVVSLEGPFGLDMIAMLLALVERRAIVVPLGKDAEARHAQYRQIAQVERRVCVHGNAPTMEKSAHGASHPYFDELRSRGAAGLVLFTSGSTGDSKAAVHDFERLLDRYETPRPTWRTLLFLHLDHIGGLNTLLFALANGGAVVVPSDRSPRAVCDVIERHRVELLPTSPTFLNLLLLSDEQSRHDLSSLRLITYGTEPMPASTLARAGDAFPGVKLQQTYGMTELGILRSQSRDNGSLWVRIGGEGYETKVVEGRLWIRARSAMLGYLNASGAFDADGFLDTGDRVEIDGEWMRILGRDKETVNVGGHKVFPAEVESVLLELDGVADAAVHGEPNPVTGQIVVATVQLSGDESLAEFKVRMRQFCRTRLPSYATPARVLLSSEPLYSERFKRKRI